MMTNQKHILFSIIVPCCDVARYVDDMVTSIREQTYGDFECLLMYEESKDNTLELLQKTVEVDNRFKLFKAPRSGSCSVPRNTGMQEAKGDYVLHIDGDDWLERDSLERFSKAIMEHGELDLIAAAASEIREHEDGHQEYTCKRFNYLPDDDGKVFSGKEATVHIGRLHVLPYPATWLTVYRLDFLQAHKMVFVPGIPDQDEEFAPRVLFLAERVLVMDYTYYNYRRREGSAMTSRKVSNLHAMALVMRSLFAFYMEHKAEVTTEIAQVWQRSWLSLFFLIFFEPRNQRGITEAVRRTELRNLLEGDGLANFKSFMKLAKLPKRIAEPLILLGRWFTLPACLYFKLIYYPMVKLRGVK
ncbi:MAG: glycosyltransferase [Victivallales bacterium]|nr:glycosyltransferase [Victivallales bacterium]